MYCFWGCSQLRFSLGISHRLSDLYWQTTRFGTLVLVIARHLAVIVATYFGSVFPRWGWLSGFYLSNEQWVIRVYFFMAWGGGATQEISATLIALNRLTALIYLQRYAAVGALGLRPEIIRGSDVFLFPFLVPPLCGIDVTENRT